jgi:hypothetical protein
MLLSSGLVSCRSYLCGEECGLLHEVDGEKKGRDILTRTVTIHARALPFCAVVMY